ncbi:MAG: M12 family metallopeptidase [Phycisphaerales bacterium JB059]
MGTTQTLAMAGLVLAAVAGQASAQFTYTSEVPHPPMRAGVAAPQFWDPDLGKWWTCTASRVPANQRANIAEAAAWNVVQNTADCFPGTTVIVPFRIVNENWFELDDEGNAIDPDYMPPEEDMDGNEEDVCQRMNPIDILIEDMVVEEENYPIIYEAMSVIEDLCGVTFVPRDPYNPDPCFPDADPLDPMSVQQPWIRIQQSTDECVPYQTLTGNFADGVGMPESGGARMIVMEDWSVSVMVHELMHALGFFHEHQRADRDTYVTVYEEHIAPNALDQFTIAGADPLNQFGDYDFESIMHYGRFAFSFNTEVVIDVNPPYENLGPEPGYEFTIGNFARPSVTDRLALQHLYGPSLLFPEDPCLAADLDDNLQVNITDLLIFIAAWSSGDPVADWNTDGVVNDQDLLAYLMSFAQAANCGPTPPRPVSPEQNTFERPG